MATRIVTSAEMTSRRDGKFAACPLHTCCPGGGGWLGGIGIGHLDPSPPACQDKQMLQNC
jgi:hypothetical protein